MGILIWLLLGLIAGILAKFVMPGRDAGGIIVTIAIGVIGAVIGGYLGTRFGIGSVTGINFESILVATGGAILLLILLRLIRRH
ncbi:MAG: GlsB/YeaQ/YmgE family stress response membrane protein [Rhodospirillaceae bacterium]|nr:GlsB/YeaQ/YmgE family stress response membrane protein [Rhodospirillaceae bacterium]